jgi:hypothetical protein
MLSGIIQAHLNALQIRDPDEHFADILLQRTHTEVPPGLCYRYTASDNIFRWTAPQGVQGSHIRSEHEWTIL